MEFTLSKTHSGSYKLSRNCENQGEIGIELSKVTKDGWDVYMAENEELCKIFISEESQFVEMEMITPKITIKGDQKIELELDKENSSYGFNMGMPAYRSNGAQVVINVIDCPRNIEDEAYLHTEEY